MWAPATFSSNEEHRQADNCQGIMFTVKPKYLIALFGLAVMLVFGGAAVAAEKAAGIVIIASGEFYAVAPDGSQRPLKRRSEYFAGEVLKTGKDSTAQIRFSDGAIVSLRPETEFRVDEYRYQNDDGADKSISTLLKGGFRTITGTIGKEGPEQYKVNTPVATIGVRGTHYEAVFGTELAVAAWQGGVTVSNDSGQLLIGAGGEYNFARVTAGNTPPVGTLTPPSNLHPAPKDVNKLSSTKNRKRSKQATATNKAPEQTATSKPGAGNTESNESGESSSPDQQLTKTADSGSTENSDQSQPSGIAQTEQKTEASDGGSIAMMTPEGEPMPQPGDSIGTPPPDGGPTPLPGDSTTMPPPDSDSMLASFADPNQQEFGEFVPMDSTLTLDTSANVVGDSYVATTTTYQEPLVQDPYINTDIFDPLAPIESLQACLCLTQAEIDSIDRLGLAVISGPFPKPQFTGGRASDGAAGTPIFTDNGLDPTSPDFFTVPPLAVMRQGTAPLASTFPVTSTLYPVSWGVWNGSAADPVELQADPTDPTVITSVTYPVFWITGLPADPVQLGLTGVKVWGSPQVFNGVGDSGQITDFLAFVGVNFSNGNAFGRMFLRTAGNDDWEVFYSGSVQGPVLDFPSVSGDVNHINGVMGEVPAFFSGTNAGAIAGSFSFQSTNDSTLHAEGTFLLDDSPDLRLTAAEKASLDRTGIAIISGPNTDFTFLGPASDGSGGSPILTDNGYDPDQTVEYAIAPPLEVLKQGTAFGVSPGPITTNIPSSAYPAGDPNYPVSWGAWDGLSSTPNPIEIYKDPNSSAPSTINQFAYWTTFIPTPLTALAARSGSVTYDSVIGIIGNGTDGPVSGSSSMAINIDFSTGAMNGNMTIDSGSYQWLMNVNGTVKGQEVEFQSVSGDYTGVTGPNDAFGNVDAMLTGDKGQAIAGGFDLQDTTNTSGVEGAFVVQCSNPSTC